MKALFHILGIVIISQSIVFSQSPNWTNYTMRNASYPEGSYLTGFISETNVNGNDPGELLQKISGYAKDQLVENILVEIKSISTLNIHNVNTVTQEEFQKNSTSFSNATIAGLKTETYYDQKKKIGFAFSFAKKSEVKNHYENEISTLLDKCNTNFELASSHKDQNNNQGALKMLFQTQTFIKNIEHAQTILITLTGKYDLTSLKRNESRIIKMKTESEINKVRNTQQFTLEDAAYYIAFALNTQTENLNAPVRVSNFTYQDTPMGSIFSRRLQSSLEQKLIQEGYKVANQAVENDGFVLRGSYWEEGDKLKITGILRDQKTSSAIASVDCYLPKSTLNNASISFTPENYKQALINMKELAKDEIKGGGLNIDLYTNKGKDNLIYTEGEELKLFVRANRECYMRFIYHLADGSKVLLLDNYYINHDNVNQVYELPYEFECAEPFGIETLQLNAQAQPFPPLATKEEYGYNFILDDTNTIITKTRGFKKKTDTEEIKAEKRMVFTTMKD